MEDAARVRERAFHARVLDAFLARLAERCDAESAERLEAVLRQGVRYFHGEAAPPLPPPAPAPTDEPRPEVRIARQRVQQRNRYLDGGPEERVLTGLEAVGAYIAPEKTLQSALVQLENNSARYFVAGAAVVPFHPPDEEEKSAQLAQVQDTLTMRRCIANLPIGSRSYDVVAAKAVSARHETAM